jgi:hypothetical protein
MRRRASAQTNSEPRTTILTPSSSSVCVTSAGSPVFGSRISARDSIVRPTISSTAGPETIFQFCRLVMMNSALSLICRAKSPNRDQAKPGFGLQRGVKEPDLYSWASTKLAGGDQTSRLLRLMEERTQRGAATVQSSAFTRPYRRLGARPFQVRMCSWRRTSGLPWSRASQPGEGRFVHSPHTGIAIFSWRVLIDSGRQDAALYVRPEA